MPGSQGESRARENLDQAEFQIVHVDIGGGANDIVEAALGLPVNSALVAAY